MVFLFLSTRESLTLSRPASTGDKETYYERDAHEEFAAIEEEDSDDVKDSKNSGCVLNDKVGMNYIRQGCPLKQTELQRGTNVCKRCLYGGHNSPEMRKEGKEFQHEHQLSPLASVYNSYNIKISYFFSSLA